MVETKNRRPEIHVRLDASLKQDIDSFRRSQERPPSPPEAIRQLVRKALAEPADKPAGENVETRRDAWPDSEMLA
jgi:Arc/MetJ-type ribon-helix-helix transcriptional regulator